MPFFPKIFVKKPIVSSLLVYSMPFFQGPLSYFYRIRRSDLPDPPLGDGIISPISIYDDIPCPDSVSGQIPRTIIARHENENNEAVCIKAENHGTSRCSAKQRGRMLTHPPSLSIFTNELRFYDAPCIIHPARSYRTFRLFSDRPHSSDPSPRSRTHKMHVREAPSARMHPRDTSA